MSSSIAVMSSGSELKLPRRMTLPVISRKNRSTTFSQEELAGTKRR
jgi:hypothetical protein